jgi:NAD(P)-dependent dehydrogenase (short-subunit alcohol dehydrogenase family)
MNEKSTTCVALVTGGTSGIGLATVRALHNEGYRVVLTGQSPERLEAAKKILPENVLVLRADSRSTADAEQIAAVIGDKFGRLDAAFLNAGIGQMLPFEAVNESTYNDHFDTNVKGPYFMLQKILHLFDASGSVVFTSALGASKGTPNWSLYSATKGALNALVRALAVELGPRRIRVNSISPGPIDTPAFSKLGLLPESVEQFKTAVTGQAPLRRIGSGADVAHLVTFLASQNSSYITGVDIAIDGGLLAS